MMQDLHTLAGNPARNVTSGNMNFTRGQIMTLPWIMQQMKLYWLILTAALRLHGIETRFFRQDGKFMVNTEGLTERSRISRSSMYSG